MPRYAEMIYYGFWFAPEREALQGFMDDVPAGRDGHRAAQALQGQRHGGGPPLAALALPPDFVTFEADSVYRQQDAEGFIRLNALRLRIRALRDQGRAAGAS